MSSNKPPVKAIDAVMGRGKTTWKTLDIKADKELRAVIVLPRKTEILRYQEKLEGVEGVVTLHDSNGDSRSKVEQFIEALTDARIILTTHSLFEEWLPLEVFKAIDEGEWSLVMDEVPTTFEKIDLQGLGTTIKGCIMMGVLMEVPVDGAEGVTRLVVNDEKVDWYLRKHSSEANKEQKDFIRSARVKDVYVIETGIDGKNKKSEDEQTVRKFYSFSMMEERLSSFKDVTIMSYPFKGSDIEHWLIIKGFTIDHQRLICSGRNNLLSDFSLEPHDGQYLEGKEFAHLLEIVEPSRRGRVLQYGDRQNHFSATECKKFVRQHKGYREKLDDIQKSLRGIYKPRRKGATQVQSEDFMFTCLKSMVPCLRNSKHGLTADFIGEDNWIPFCERGVNDHAHKTELCFLFNVFPFTEIEKTVEGFGRKYDRDLYALYVMIQWIWRSAIRDGHKVRLYIPSKRMRTILEKWLKGKNV